MKSVQVDNGGTSNGDHDQELPKLETGAVRAAAVLRKTLAFFIIVFGVAGQSFNHHYFTVKLFPACLPAYLPAKHKDDDGSVGGREER